MKFRLNFLLLGLLTYLHINWAFIFGDNQNANRDFHAKLVSYNSSKKSEYEESFSQVVYIAPPDPFGPSLKKYSKREAIEPIFKGKPKTREEIWHRSFKIDEIEFDQAESLIILLVRIFTRYMMDCTPVILYDIHVERSEGYLMKRLMAQLPVSFLHGKISANYTLMNPKILDPLDSSCHSYIMFLADVMQARKILGPQVDNRVVIIPRSTQWKLQEFLMAPQSRDIVNLLVIGESYSADKLQERAYVLYTHRLYVDGLGSNKPVLLTSSMKGKLSRPHVDLFPKKLRRGFAGHRFAVAAGNQPPFIFKKLSTDGVGNIQITWEGLEVRILSIMSQKMNFSFIINEPHHQGLGPGDAVTEMITSAYSDIGFAGMYVTKDRNEVMDMSTAHSMDCAAFMTLSSRTLPRSRAILGPFQWPVWVCLTLVYLLAIFPLSFSNHLTFKHLLGNWGEIENMFWYVFGTFTNSLTFSGEFSWSNTKKTSTRLLIGVYWVFTIIITACYTGSIIAFVTLPVKPDTVDTLDQLSTGFFRIGTYDRGGWERWFLNSTHHKTASLMKKLEFVTTVEEGVNNVTQAWFWPYAFIASKRELEYIIDTNYTENKIGRRSALHVSDGCFALFSVGFSMPPKTVYRNKFNMAILRMLQGGLIDKMLRDVNYEERKRASKRAQPILGAGKVSKTQAPEERSLNLADTEGMFLFLGIGFIIGLGALISEWVGGCTNRVIGIMKRKKGEKIERERIEHEHEHELEHEQELEHEHKYEERRPSFFIGWKKSRSSTPKSTDRLSMASNSDTSIASISKKALQELYDGPAKKISAMVCLDGQLVPDDQVYKVQREAMIRKEVFLPKAQSEGGSSSGRSDTSHSRRIDTIAEVNQDGDADAAIPNMHHRRSLSAVNDDIFGEKVFY